MVPVPKRKQLKRVNSAHLTVALPEETEPAASSPMLLDRDELDLTVLQFSRDGYDRLQNTESLSRVGFGALGRLILPLRDKVTLLKLFTNRS